MQLIPNMAFILRIPADVSITANGPHGAVDAVTHGFAPESLASPAVWQRIARWWEQNERPAGFVCWFTDHQDGRLPEMLGCMDLPLAVYVDWSSVHRGAEAIGGKTITVHVSVDTQINLWWRITLWDAIAERAAWLSANDPHANPNT